MEEIWKDIKDYEGFYLVSNLGAIRSLDRIDRAGRTRKGIILKLQSDREGYLTVILKVNGNQKNMRVHRLVAQAFIDNPSNLLEVDHINCKRNDNCVTNLRWCTRKLNSLNELSRIHNSKALKKYIQSFKGRKNIAKLSKPVCQIADDDSIIIIFNSIREASRKLNISSLNIRACCLGKRKTAGGYKFKLYEPKKPA